MPIFVIQYQIGLTKIAIQSLIENTDTYSLLTKLQACLNIIWHINEIEILADSKNVHELLIWLMIRLSVDTYISKHYNECSKNIVSPISFKYFPGPFQEIAHLMSVIILNVFFSPFGIKIFVCTVQWKNLQVFKLKEFTNDIYWNI